MAAGSVSRILSASRSLQDGHSSRPHITMRLQRPTRNFHPIAGSLAVDAPSRRVRTLLPARSLFGLAPCGVCHAPTITGRAVRSYRTFSPLPRPKPGGMFSVALAVDWPLRQPPGRYPAHCSAEFGLSSRTGEPAPATVRSGCQLQHYIEPHYPDVRKELWRRPTRISDRAEYCIRSRRQTSLN